MSYSITLRSRTDAGITGWYDASMGHQSFLEAMVSSRYREQYEDAVSCFLRAQEVNMTVPQKNLAELVAKGLDSAGDKVAAQAQAAIDKAAVLNCWIVSTPGGRF